METVGNSIIFFASLFVVIGRETLSPGIVGLSITYAMNVRTKLYYFLYLFVYRENYLNLENVESLILQNLCW